MHTKKLNTKSSCHGFKLNLKCAKLYNMVSDKDIENAWWGHKFHPNLIISGPSLCDGGSGCSVILDKLHFVN